MCFSFWVTLSPSPPTGAPPLNSAGGLPSPDPLLCSSKISFKNPLHYRYKFLLLGYKLVTCIVTVLLTDHRVWELEQQLKAAECCDGFKQKQPPLNFKVRSHLPLTNCDLAAKTFYRTVHQF